MFQLNDFTEAHVATVTNRVEKHGDDDKPAVTLALEITAPNTLLDTIDPKIRHALYMAVEGQEQLPGIEVATPVLRCNSFETHTLTVSHEGWTLAVDDGIDDTDPMVFGGVKCDKFKVEAKQGGSIVLKFRAGTSDVDADKLGKLAMHNGQSVWITLKAPEKKPDAIDGTKEAFERDHPPVDDDEGRVATDLFVDAHAGDPEPDDGQEDDEGGVDAEADRPKVHLSDEASWPFPRGDKPGTEISAPPPEDVLDAPAAARSRGRTARGKKAMKDALAAGAAS